MKLLVAADSLFLRTSDGKYWCKTIYGYNFWSRYLSVFEEIVIVSRTKPADSKEVLGYLRVDGQNINVVELPYMRGMKQYIKHYFTFIRAVKKAVKNAECALIRLPSVSAFMVLKYFKLKGKPYALEVVADPFDAYASNKIAQYYYTKKLKEATLQANGVSYVTSNYLQERYPSTARISNYKEDNFFESYYSTIDLKEDFFSQPRAYDIGNSPFKIVHTANSINTDNKGHATILNIVKKLRDQNFNIEVTFIGDGSKKAYYQQLSRQLDIDEYVNFTGLLSSPQEVREELLNGDIFVFPTKAEGLPRAVIEAMAVGLPCLSTPVNGIPELLKDEYLFDPLDVNSFSNKIIELINNPKELEKMSNENVEKALEYIDIKLIKKREDFYMKLKKLCI
ncbi:glycosyltransferase family 4 protein [Oceanobacillus longus]|uniref:Glycosyltransferase family 4 protein n=1 Tax=Oceanobacillus longus TaxID=930120 RepID=A0ABV8GZ31_9BACI